MKTTTKILKTVSKHFLFPAAMVLLLLGQNVLHAQSDEQKVKLQGIAERAAEGFRLKKASGDNIKSEGLQVQANNDDLIDAENQAFTDRPYACEKDLIEIMFVEDASVRLRDGVLVDLETDAMDGIDQALEQLNWHTWSRICDVPEHIVDQWSVVGKQNTGKPVYNMNNIYRLQIPEGNNIWELCKDIEKLPGILSAKPVPKPMELPTPGNYQSNQGYLNPASSTPTGIDAIYAWTQNGGNGSGVTICDLEYSWNYNHADISKAYGSQINTNVVDPFNNTDHGTAVVGVLAADNNGWGATGICYGANLKTCGTYYGNPVSWNVAGAITLAISHLSPGDIILLEQQWDYTGSQGYVPVEWYTNTSPYGQTNNPVYAAIVNAVSNGIHVVEAGGNGNINTDVMTWYGNSGAIIVGAGGAYTGGTWFEGDLEKLSFSSYGSRFDLQGWGENVVTTGYGDLYSAQGPNYWFTSTFSGTSSASPIVAGALACDEGYYLANVSTTPPTPAAMRTHLIASGTPQVTPPYGNIGPRPNLNIAINSYNSGCNPPTNFSVSATATDATLTWTEPIPPPQQGYDITIRDPAGVLVFYGNPVSGTNTITATGLTPSITYIAAIRSYCGGSLYFSPWQVITFTTLSGVCDPPTNLTVSATATDATLTWTEPVPPPQPGYEIEIIDLFTGLVVFTGNTPSGTNAFTVTGLSPSTNYIAEIRSNCWGGFFSSWESVIFTTLPGACDPPTGFTAQPLSATEVELSWIEPVPAPQQGYEIEITDFTGLVVFTGNTPSGTNAFTVTGLTPSTDYNADIRSDCGNGMYSWWRLAIFTTLPGSCDPPTNFTVSATATDATLIWTEPVPPPQQGYEIMITDLTGVVVFNGNAPAGTNAFTVSGLTPSTDYVAALRSDCGSGVFSSWEWVAFTTCTQFMVQAPADFEVCINEPAFALSGATPLGGTYAGNGVAGNIFDPALSGVGIHTISYTYTDAYGCSGSDTFVITVHDLPVVTCPADFSVFLYNAPFALTGGTPAGGIYTDASGNVISNFDPSSAGSGNHKINYTYTDNNGCSSSCEFWIEVLSDLDFGDAPDVPQGFNYHTLLAQNGARHVINQAVYLGDKIDAETDGQPTIGALGDDINNLGDEDGVQFSRFMAVGSMAKVRVKASVAGYLNAWVDFNRDGVWTGAAEQIFIDELLSAGWNTLSFAVPANAQIGSSYARFRFNTAGGLSYQGAAADGEVEDYFVAIFPQSWAFAITNLSHMILVPLSAVFPLAAIPGDITLEEGDFIGAFFDDQGSPKCGGAIYIDSTDNQMLIAYGDDLLTNEKDGFDNAEPFSFKIYKANTDEIIDVEATFDTSMPNFDGKFYSNGMSAFTGLNKIKLSQTLTLAEGWNGISTWLDPADADVVNMFAPINNEFLILYKLNGGIYWPGQNLNTLGQWNLYDGHIINLINDVNLEVLGDTVANRTVNINNGVSLIPVLTDDVVDVVTLFNAIQGLDFVKEVAGNRIYLPNWNINTLGSLIPGSSYFVLSSQAGIISYPAASLKMSSEDLYPEPAAINHPWNEISYTPESHIVVFNSPDAPFMDGDIVGGFTSDGYTAGVTEVQADKAFALTLNGNDVFTNQKTGFDDEELLTYKVHRPSTGEIFALEVVYNPDMTMGSFTANGISEVMEVKASALGIGNITASQISIYPNPSSGKFNITGVDGLAEIEVNNAYGKLMLRQTLDLSQGIDLSSYPNGVYLLKITTSKGIESMHKLIVH